MEFLEEAASIELVDVELPIDLSERTVKDEEASTRCLKSILHLRRVAGSE